MAQRIFGDDDPIGKMVKFYDEPYQIAAVVDLYDKNTHLAYDVYTKYTWHNPSWTSNCCSTYIKVKSKTSVPDLESKIETAVNEMIKKDYVQNNFAYTAESFPAWKMQPLEDVHLHSENFYASGQSGSIRYLYIFL